MTCLSLTGVAERYAPLAQRLAGGADRDGPWRPAGEWPALAALAELFGLSSQLSSSPPQHCLSP